MTTLNADIWIIGLVALISVLAVIAMAMTAGASWTQAMQLAAEAAAQLAQVGQGVDLGSAQGRIAELVPRARECLALQNELAPAVLCGFGVRLDPHAITLDRPHPSWESWVNEVTHGTHAREPKAWSATL